MVERIKETFKFIWFVIKIPYILLFDPTIKGGAGGLESEFENYEENK